MRPSRAASGSTANRCGKTRPAPAWRLLTRSYKLWGRDISDPVFVVPEYPVGSYKADYALLKPDGHPAATVEAKKLGEGLESHRMQMLNYSNASGVDYAGITDGNRWELYDVFKRGQLEDRRVLDITIADTTTHRCALQLLLIWRPNLASGEPVAANEPILSAHSAPPDPRFTNVQRSVTVAPPSPSNEGWTSLAEFFPKSVKSSLQRFAFLVEKQGRFDFRISCS